MNYLDTNDNIVALATADGLASVSIVRISGRRLGKLYTLISKKKTLPRANSIYFNKIHSPKTKEHLDDGLIAYFKNAASFTGESVLEVNCHGGNYVASHLINDIVESGAARHALPGEFSFRAFYNGKIDLLQAESINDLIHAETDVYVKKSLDNVSGELSKTINSIKNAVLNVISLVEHELDFNPDEIVFTNTKDLLKQLLSINVNLEKIESSFLHSKMIRNGIRVLLLGRANVGKSSLFNYLMGEQRAIVSNVRGTTRDAIESVFEIGGYRVSLVDSAGMLKSKDSLEKMAVEKTKNEIELANIIIWLSDDFLNLNEYDRLLKNKSVIKVLTKADIIKHSGLLKNTLKISSKTGQNIPELLTMLSTEIKFLTQRKNRAGEFLINKRHYALIKKSKIQIERAIDGLSSGMTHDILADILHEFLFTFNNISTPVGRKDIINNIFSSFCVGK